MSSRHNGGEAPARSLEDLPFAFGGAVIRGAIRARPEDFRVDELLGFEPAGSGEHAFLHVEKRGQNTAWVAQQLARFSAVRLVAVGYAGLKDRNAVTRQYFTVQLPGRESPDWSRLDLEGVEVLSATRHDRKLQTGALRANRFRIVARGVEGDREAARDRLEELRRQGVPNYFGEQRFGRGGENLHRAEKLFRGADGRVPRHKRSIYLSAARSHLFNAVLSRRVADGTWRTGIDGEVYALDGSRAIFGPEPLSAELTRRLDLMDIHPTGPLWGRGEPPTSRACLKLESSVLREFELFRRGLEERGMKQQRRSLRLPVRELEFELASDELKLEFTLPAGAYATVVLRELLGN